MGCPGRGVPRIGAGVAGPGGGEAPPPPPGAVTPSRAHPAGMEGGSWSGRAVGRMGPPEKLGRLQKSWTRGGGRPQVPREPVSTLASPVPPLRASRWASLQFQQPQREPGATGGADGHLRWGIRDPSHPQAQPAAFPGAGAERLRSQPVSQGGGQRQTRASMGKDGQGLVDSGVSQPGSQGGSLGMGHSLAFQRGCQEFVFRGRRGVATKKRPEQPRERALQSCLLWRGDCGHRIPLGVWSFFPQIPAAFRTGQPRGSGEEKESRQRASATACQY